MPRAAARGLFACCALVLAAAALAAAPVPRLEHRVTDLTNTLSESQRANLEKRLASLESRKGSQVAVLLVPSIQPETIEQYATRVFDQWKLGRRKVDDGVLLVIAKDDRKLRIEVGYGLEGAIPDAIARRIIDEEIVPRFRQGDFYGGVLHGTDRIAKLVEGEAMPPPSTAPSVRPWQDFSGLWIWGFLALFLVGVVLRALIGRLQAASVIALVAGLATFLAFGAVTAAGTAIVMFLLTLFDTINTVSRWMELYAKASGGDGTSGGGSWSTGSDSWSSSDSGFGGGGGSSGGGGASGSW